MSELLSDVPCFICGRVDCPDKPNGGIPAAESERLEAEPEKK